MLSNGIKRSSLLAYGAPTFCLMFLVGPAQSLIQGVYTQHFGLKLADLASIILICRIFDAFTDPAIGFISDRTRGSLPGGRKFIVVVGAVLSTIAVYFLFIPQTSNVTPGYFFIWFLLCYLGWTLIEIPHLSWGSELSNDYKDRATVFSYRTIFYYLGYVGFLALPFLPVFTEKGYTPETLVVAFWVVAITFPVTVFFATKFCPQGENRKTHGKTNVFHSFQALKWNKPLRNFTFIFILLGLGLGLQTGIAFLYITSFLGLAEDAPLIFLASFPFAVIGLPVWLKISKTIGKHYGIAIGACLTSFAFLGLVFIAPGPSALWSFFIVNCIIHFLQSSWISIGPSMLGDIIDYDQATTGEDNSATYYSFFTFMRKLFEGIGGGLGICIAATYGFEPANLVINDDVIFSMHLVMGYLPALVFIAAAFICLHAPITKQKHAEILAKISNNNKDQLLAK